MTCQLKPEGPEDQKWLPPILKLLSEWDGHADSDSSAYPIIRDFRDEFLRELIFPIAQKVSPDQPEKVFKYLRRDGLVYQLLTHKPKNLLNPEFSSYCELVKTCLIKSGKNQVSEPALLHELKWGNLNKSRIHHPFSKILPSFLGGLLNFPEKPMSGDALVPNVMNPTNGASMRMVVDLFDPTASFFSHPGGQSGNFYSSHYSDSFSPWLTGKSLPFEMGRIVMKETLLPRVLSEAGH
jgi:penicillin amidase